MPDHDADAHTDRHTIFQLRNTLKAKDEEIAALKGVLDRFLKPRPDDDLDAIEAPTPAEAPSTAHEDFTTARSMSDGIRPGRRAVEDADTDS